MTAWETGTSSTTPLGASGGRSGSKSGICGRHLILKKRNQNERAGERSMNECRNHQCCGLLRSSGRAGCEQAIFEHEFLLFDRRPAQLGDLGALDTMPLQICSGEIGRGVAHLSLRVLFNVPIRNLKSLFT